MFTYNESEKGTVLPLEKITVLLRTVGEPNTSALPNRFRGFYIAFDPPNLDGRRLYPYAIIVANTDSVTGSYKLYRSQILDLEGVLWLDKDTNFGLHQHLSQRLLHWEALNGKVLAVSTAMHKSDIPVEDYIYRETPTGSILFVAAVIDNPNPWRPTPGPSRDPVARDPRFSELGQQLDIRWAGFLPRNATDLDQSPPFRPKPKSELHKQAQR